MKPEVVGRYQIVREMGTGGMGSVFLAHDPLFSRDVALKFLHATLSDEATLRERFEREAQTIASLEHHAIVPVYDFGQHEAQLYLVMRLMRGGALKARLQEGPLHTAQIASIVGPIASALDKAHENGIIHRDVKPANILFDDEGKPYLSDFGIVKLYEEASQLTRTGGVLGTPAYMSPEQGLGQPVDGRSDIYSLGVVLYEMATGRVPFQADTAIATVLKHVQEPLPPPREGNPAISENVERVIVRALAKQPEDRFDTAGQMAGALQARPPRPQGAWRGETLLDAPPADTPTPVSAAEPTPERFSRQTYLAAGGILMLLLAIVAGGWWVASGQGEATRPTVTPQQPPLAAITVTATEAGSPTATVTVSATPTAQPIPSATPYPTPSITPTGAAGLAADDVGPPTGQIVFTCFNGGFDDICRMNADGSGQRRLTSAPATEFYGSYDPTGRFIVYSSRQSGDFHLYRMNADGAGARRISPDVGSMFAPAVSPDGRRITFTNAVGDRQSIWVMDVGGDNLQRLTDEGGDDLDPVWSPDGSQIAFSSDRTGVRAHYVMNADGSGLRMLRTGIEEIGGRSDWSPDGSWLAFYAGPRNERDIYLVAVDGSGETRRLTDGGSNLAPSFSPKGGWITFTSYRNGNDAEIYIMRVDGSDVRQLTDNERPDWQPRWGPE